MKRRTGSSLMEVLVAIFILGIGLLAILTLFPLGALRMAQAIQDDRVAHCAPNAASLAQAFDLRTDPQVTWAFRDPDRGANPVVLLPAHPDGPGYSVYVDPIGHQTLLSPTWVGGSASKGILRVKPSYVLTGGVLDSQKMLRWFTFQDDLRFLPDGRASTTAAAGSVDRDGLYSWAYMLRSPRSSASIAELSVVVYYRRPLSAAGAQSTEYLYDNSTFTPATNTILINAAGRAIPPLRPGSWILDATVKTGTYPHSHGYFYRVVNVTEVPAPSPATGTNYEVEVATPLRGWGPAGGTGRVIIMDGVIEVLEKGTGWTL